MHERHDIEAVVDGVAVTKFLVPAVALIFRCTEDRNLESRISLLVAEAVNEGVVPGKIVDNQNLDVAALQALRNTAEDRFDRGRGVVGHDENEQPLAAQINPIRRD